MRKFIPDFIKAIPPQAERKFSGEIFDVYQWPQEMFDGSVETFEMLKRSDTVIIIAIRDGKIVLTHQKQPYRDWFYSFPGGRTDASDADELAAAKRELREETGMTFANWKLIKVTQPFSKVDWLVYTFLATDFLEQSEQHLDSGELIEVLEVGLDELVQLSHQPDGHDIKLDFGGLGETTNLQQLQDLPALYNY